MKKYIYLIIILITGLISCERYFEPLVDNSLTEENLLRRPTYAEGILLRGYIALPNDYNFYTDVATDDAVTNLQGSSYTRMATGEWSSSYYPGNPWTSAFQQIFYMNKFLDIYEKVTWAVEPRFTKEDNEIRNMLYKKRFKGEAHGLRAYYKYLLLLHHSGKTKDGRLLGFPIINDMIDPSDNWKLPRNTFAECVQSIMNDLDIAIDNLPAIYEDIGEFNIDQTSGARYRNRMDGNTARALKARVALLAASPAYSESQAVTWEEAATIAGNLLSDLGTLLPTGKTFYTTTRNKEIIWNRALRNIRTWEENNFPPSLFGNARTNPSQNLVDAFPMKNGYPINHPNSNYNPDEPYQDRDDRLNDYIIYNKSTFKNNVINTYIGADLNGINVLLTSTRTGYYLKKFMAPEVTLSPTAPINSAHTYTLFRETEVLLNYAEAANEAWGPDGDPNGFGFTARTKIAELRKRAGITQPDNYLENDITSKDDMRTLIRNERRLELCFEGFRFWDIRRWNDISAMQKSVKGAYITLDEGVFSYEYRDVEIRAYQPYMIYGPIPFNETLKYDIDQNNGW